MNVRHRIRFRFWWVIAALLTSNLALATSTNNTQTLNRTQLDFANIHGGAPVFLSPAYPDPTATHRLEIRLKFEPQAFAADGGTQWSYTVRYVLITNVGVGPERQLTLFRGTERDVFSALDLIDPIDPTNTDVYIVGTDSPDFAAVPLSLQFSAVVVSTRYSAFSRQVAPTLTFVNGSDPIVSWTPVTGAEEYEVEIAYVDALESVQPTDAFKASLPVRIQTTATSVAVDLHRPAGVLKYRVRAVGRHSGGVAKRPGAWSATLSVPVGAFETNKNWHYRQDYDESGPGNATLTYFDSILQPRQVQKRAPGQDRRLVAETKYDYEGRPAVNFLATPAVGHKLSYLAGFNRAADGEVFGPKHFDLKGVVAASTTSGAAKYFSGQTDAVGPGADFVPDAEGYPFSVAEHTRDDSARLRASSGFGPRLKLGASHDSIYIYGDASESQLRPLFGANLGNAGNYERTVTSDANRVYEVSYRDAQDHIIAQGQIGEPPANLADLATTPTPQPVTVSMDRSNNVNAIQGRSVLSYRIANSVNTNYFFEYSVNGVEYSANPGDPRFPPLCESCSYRLKIQILDPDGNKVPLVTGSTAQNDPDCTGDNATPPSTATPTPTPTIYEINKVVKNNNPHTCQAGVDEEHSYAVDPVRFCATFTEPGEYEVRKELTLLDGSIDASIQGYEGKPKFFTVDTYRKPIDPAACGTSCEQHCAEATGVNPATSPNNKDYEQCLSACQHPEQWILDRVENEKCASLESALKADVAPEGRYHNSTNGDWTRHPEYCHLDVCKKLKPSERYDVAMGEAQTYNDALCQGYLNPLNLAPDPALGPPDSAICATSPTSDPFFAPGGIGESLAATAEFAMHNYTDTIAGWSGTKESLWQFAADKIMHPNASTISVDDQWRAFRSLYLGIKQRLVVQATESILNCPYSTDPHPHVPKPPLPDTADEVLDEIAAAQAWECQSLCSARVSQWMTELTQVCGSAPTNPQVAKGLTDYCASVCGPDNPLGLLTKEALAAGATGLATANAALQGCSLDDIAVPDPYIRTTVCREKCCSDTTPTECAKLLLDVLREREPVVANGDISLVNTELGRQLQERCIRWVESVRALTTEVDLQTNDGSRSCKVMLIDEDGKTLDPHDIHVIGPASTIGREPGATSPNVPKFTGLFIDVSVSGRVVHAAVYSDCDVPWVDDLGQPECTTQAVYNTTAADTSCEVATKPSECLTSLVTVLRKLGSSIPRTPKSACYSNLRLKRDALEFELKQPHQSCRIVVVSPHGQVVQLSDLRAPISSEWAPDDSNAPQVVKLKYTGFKITAAGRGSRDSKPFSYFVYSNCSFEPEPDCDTFVTGTNLPPWPPAADPHDVCIQASNEAADQAAQIALNEALGEFEQWFKSVHYNRCFGDQLRESFQYTADAQEYHFTLRYYDQAGNLEQTVPPEGIAPLTAAQVADYSKPETATVNPKHRMISSSAFDSLDRLIQQTTPDSGKRNFWYNHKGQLRFSQNAQQETGNKFAYTKYRFWGRVIEFGLFKPKPPIGVTDGLNLEGYPKDPDNGDFEEKTTNYYDSADKVPVCAPLSPTNLRGRLAAVVATTTPARGEATLCYSYDAQATNNAILRNEPGIGTKIIKYDLDALNGRVKSVAYQPGKADALYQRNTFDRRGALVDVKSSRDNLLWDRDAHYDYFEYGTSSPRHHWGRSGARPRLHLHHRRLAKRSQYRNPHSRPRSRQRRC